MMCHLNGFVVTAGLCCHAVVSTANKAVITHHDPLTPIDPSAILAEAMDSQRIYEGRMRAHSSW